jgi:hypothetical protein
MNPTSRSRTSVRLVSILLLLVWGCEDADNLARVDPVRTDAASETQIDQSAPPEVVPDGPSDTTDAQPDVPTGVDSADAALDLPSDVPDARVDAGHDGPADTGADQLDGASPDMLSEVPSDATEATCPGNDCPRVIAPGHLQLWLSADDEAVDCRLEGVVARVRQWPDRSEKGNHARPAENQLGPLCGPSAGKLNGRNVITFPRTMGQQNGEHLEISLASIQDRPFTVVIVEKRPHVMDVSAWMLGGSVENPYDACVPQMAGANAGRVLQIGYGRRWQMRASTWGPSCGVIADGTPATDGGMADPAAPNATTMWVVTVSGDKKLSLFVNGRKAAEAQGEGLGQVMAPLKGFIGRGFQPSNTDSRFKGDIAEVLIFDLALDDEQRRTLERHLQPRWGFAITN